MIVLDASAAVEVLLQSRVAAFVTERILAESEELHAPHLIDVEVAQACRRLVAAGEVPEARAEQALTDLADLPLERYPHEMLLPRAWELRHNLTIYDGAYVALAELLRAPLLTRDRRIERTARALIRVEAF